MESHALLRKYLKIQILGAKGIKLIACLQATLNLLIIFCQAQSQLQPSWTGLALLSLWYQPASQPASHPATQPPGTVSNLTSNLNQSIQIRLTQLKIEDDLNFFCKWKTTSILL
jgi:hypothetical protein